MSKEEDVKVIKDFLNNLNFRCPATGNIRYYWIEIYIKKIEYNSWGDETFYWYDGDVYDEGEIDDLFDALGYYDYEKYSLEEKRDIMYRHDEVEEHIGEYVCEWSRCENAIFFSQEEVEEHLRLYSYRYTRNKDDIRICFGSCVDTHRTDRFFKALSDYFGTEKNTEDFLK